MRQFGLRVGLFSIIITGFAASEESYVYFSTPEGAKKTDVASAAKALQIRCEAYGYQGVVADTVHQPDDTWLVRLKQPATGFTADMLHVVECLAMIQGKKAEMFIGHTLTDAEAQQFKVPKEGEDLEKSPAPKGMDWFPKWGGASVLCVGERVCEISGMNKSLLTFTDKTEHQGEFTLSEDAKIMLSRRAPKEEYPLYVSFDGRFVVPLVLEWKEYQTQVWVGPTGHYDRQSHWIQDTPGHYETASDRLLEASWQVTEDQRAILSVAAASAGWPATSVKEYERVKECRTRPLPFPLAMKKDQKPAPVQGR